MRRRLEEILRKRREKVEIRVKDGRRNGREREKERSKEGKKRRRKMRKAGYGIKIKVEREKRRPERIGWTAGRRVRNEATVRESKEDA